MRVDAVHVLGGDQFARVDRGGGDGDGRLLLAEAVEHLPELALQRVAGVEDEVGVAERAHVARAGLVQVRIDARTHQLRDLGAVAGDVLGDVGDHPDRGQHLHGRFALRAGEGGRHENGEHDQRPRGACAAGANT